MGLPEWDLVSGKILAFSQSESWLAWRLGMEITLANQNGPFGGRKRALGRSVISSAIAPPPPPLGIVPYRNLPTYPIFPPRVDE